MVTRRHFQQWKVSQEVHPQESKKEGEYSKYNFCQQKREPNWPSPCEPSAPHQIRQHLSLEAALFFQQIKACSADKGLKQ
ncbi:unnamed protein product [Coccothraustes coccothraustes]